MVDVRSWKVWVIFALSLGTLACASKQERIERRDQAREDRRERIQALRQARQERQEQQRARRVEEPAEGASEQEATPAAPAAAQEPQQASEPAPSAQPQRRLSARERAAQDKAEREARRSGRAQPQARPTQQAAAPAATQAALRPAPPPVPVASDGADRIVFIRSSTFAGEGKPSVFDVTDPNNPKLVGVLARGSKLAYPIRPGQYVFMVASEAADFMQVTVVSGRTYYALVTPRIGGTWNSRFMFEPLRGKDGRIDRFSQGLHAAEAAPTPVAAGVLEKHAQYRPEWDGISKSQRDFLTLHAEDGR